MNLRIPWHVLGLIAVFAAAVVAAVIELGPPTRSTRTSTEIVTAADGVVQSTVTGTGNVEAGTDVEANFQTSGTLQNIYVKDGDHVVKGQLLATLDPTAAQLTLDQAQESLTSAQDNLANAEAQTATSGSASLTNAQTATEFVDFKPAQTSTTQTTTTTTTSTTPTTGTTTRPTRTTPTRTTPTRTTSSGSGSSAGGSRSSNSGSSGSSSSGSGSARSGGSSGGSGQTSTTSAQTLAANIASAQAAVDGAEATVQNAEDALHETHMYAPATGTVVNVADVSPGDTVSSSGATASSGSGSSATSGSSSTSGSGSGSTAGSLGGSSSSSSSSSSSGLIEIVNTASMTMTVAFSESDISKIKDGQPATVTLEALSGVELSAHVSSISTLGTSNSGVVSYDATLTLDQRDSRVKPGMSASAAVITAQASGVNLPNSAVTTTGSLGHVNLLRNGKAVPTTVVVGLVGDSRTQIVSGLRTGDQIQVTTTLPALGASSSQPSSGSSGTLGGAAGLGGAGRFLGGGAGFAGGGGFRGGGGGGFRGGG